MSEEMSVLPQKADIGSSHPADGAGLSLSTDNRYLSEPILRVALRNLERLYIATRMH